MNKYDDDDVSLQFVVIKKLFNCFVQRLEQVYALLCAIKQAFYDVIASKRKCVWLLFSRGVVENTRLVAKAKDSLSEDRPSRGQEQECSRPRTKDTAFKKVFLAISNLYA